MNELFLIIFIIFFLLILLFIVIFIVNESKELPPQKPITKNVAFIGQKFSPSVPCQSGLFSDPVSGICQGKLGAGPCNGGTDCISGLNCISGVCSNSDVGGCVGQTPNNNPVTCDCATFDPQKLTPVNENGVFICKFKSGVECSINSDCESNYCIESANRVCADLLPPGGTCNINGNILRCDGYNNTNGNSFGCNTTGNCQYIINGSAISNGVLNSYCNINSNYKDPPLPLFNKPPTMSGVSCIDSLICDTANFQCVRSGTNKILQTCSNFQDCNSNNICYTPGGGGGSLCFYDDVTKCSKNRCPGKYICDNSYNCLGENDNPCTDLVNNDGSLTSNNTCVTNNCSNTNRVYYFDTINNMWVMSDTNFISNMNTLFKSLPYDICQDIGGIVNNTVINSKFSGYINTDKKLIPTIFIRVSNDEGNLNQANGCDPSQDIVINLNINSDVIFYTNSVELYISTSYKFSEVPTGNNAYYLDFSGFYFDSFFPDGRKNDRQQIFSLFDVKDVFKTVIYNRANDVFIYFTDIAYNSSKSLNTVGTQFLDRVCLIQFGAINETPTITKTTMTILPYLIQTQYTTQTGLKLFTLLFPGYQTISGVIPVNIRPAPNRTAGPNYNICAVSYYTDYNYYTAPKSVEYPDGVYDYAVLAPDANVYIYKTSFPSGDKTQAPSPILDRTIDIFTDGFPDDALDRSLERYPINLQWKMACNVNQNNKTLIDIYILYPTIPYYYYKLLYYNESISKYVIFPGSFDNTASLSFIDGNIYVSSIGNCQS